MSRFVSEAERKTIHAPWWDEDEEVVIKRLSYGDRQVLAGEATKVDLAADGGRMTEVQVGKMNLAVLRMGIASWTLKGPDGTMPPVNGQWIYRLQDRDAEFILGEINAYNPRRSADEQAGFRAEAGDGTEEQSVASGAG